MSALAIAGALTLASPANAAITLFWDFWDGAGNDNGWTNVAGVTNYRAGDGGGAGPANADNSDYAHDGAHPNYIFRSPTIDLSGASATGDVMSWGTSGGAGDQQSNGPDYANPGAVLAFNGGNSDASGEKGLAFLNTATGQYDAVFFNPDNGGTEVLNFTLSDLTTAGVNPAQEYQIDFYETDQVGWGWGQMNFLNLDAAVVPEPSSAILLGLGGLAFLRRRRK